MTDEKEPTKSEPGSGEAAAAVAEAPAHGDDAAAAEEKKEKLEQKVDISDSGPCRKHIKVTVSRADIDKRLDEKYAELVGDSVVPGFRPGKAPRNIVIRKFKGEVTEQIRGQILLASLEQLADDFDIA